MGLLGAGQASMTLQADAFGKPLPLANGTTASIMTGPAANSLGLWVCLTDLAPPPECASRCDAPNHGMVDPDVRPCLYITPACECIQWRPWRVSANLPGWSLGESDGACARIVHVHNATFADTIRHSTAPLLTTLTIDWELEAVDRLPSRTALRLGRAAYGILATLTNACALAAREPLSVSAGRAWGCQRRMQLGIWVNTHHL